MGNISKVGLTGLVDGLDEEAGYIDCKHDPDSSPSLYPPLLPYNFELSSACLSLDLTMYLALANRMKWKYQCSGSESDSGDPVLPMSLSSP